MLTGYYYIAECRETAISAIIRKIDGTRFNGEGSGQSYEKVTGKLCDCFQQLKAIGKDAEICPSKYVIYLLKAIKVKNTDLIVGILTIKNDLEPSGKAINLKKAVSYLKNCVPDKSSKYFSNSSIDAGDKRKFQVEIKALKHTMDENLRKGGGSGKIDPKEGPNRISFHATKMAKNSMRRRNGPLLTVVTSSGIGNR